MYNMKKVELFNNATQVGLEASLNNFLKELAINRHTVDTVTFQHSYHPNSGSNHYTAMILYTISL